LAFVVERSDKKEDLYVVPISLKDGRTDGPAVKVLNGWDKRYSYDRTFSWSPDGTKIAVSHEGDIWMASAAGGEPVQATVTKHLERSMRPRWSPDGEMICYIGYHTDKEQIFRVIPTSGSEDKVILDIPMKDSNISSQRYQWSTDSKDFVFFFEGAISAISIADGKSRQILDLKGLSIDDAWRFSWSPDRQKLAFIGYRKAKDEYQIFMLPAEGGKFTELADDDTGQKYYLWWSPDGKWISYQSDGPIKTRPEAEIWEVDVSELLSAGESEQ
jgi:Tol biopolymer transport system component